MPTQLDGSQAFFVAQVAHSNSSEELFWHIDNKYLGSTKDLHQMALSPSKGFHRITVVDSYANEASVEIILNR